VCDILHSSIKLRDRERERERERERDLGEGKFVEDTTALFQEFPRFCQQLVIPE